MFRKIVTESTYSPALAASLSDYAKKLRHETTKRQIGLIFIALALVVQTFVIIAPPESANASNPEVVVEGGISSVEEFLYYYDQNTTGIKDLLTHLGVTRLDIETTIPTSLQSPTDASLWFMENSRDEKNVTYPYSAPNGDQKAAYHRPFDTDGTPVAAYVGSSSPLGWFAILKNSGNLVTRSPAAAACTPWSPAVSELQPIDLWSDTVECHEALELHLTAHNISTNTSAASQKARASDRISYTLLVKNNGDNTISVPPAIAIEDILEYAHLVDRGGGQYSPSTNILLWPETTLAPQESLARSFIVQLLPVIPSTAQGQFVKSSYDCTLTASFGKQLSVPIECPFAKTIETATANLPDVPTGLNLTLAAGLLISTSFLYFRSRQLLAELRIIRHNHLGSL